MRSQTGRPPCHSEKAAEGERDNPEQGQAPPCASTAATPGRAQLGAAPEHPLVHGGCPPRGSRPGRQSLGRREGRGHRGAGSSGWAAWPPPHRARAPILSLLWKVFSGSCNPPRLAPQSIRNIAEAKAADGGLVQKGSPGKQQARSGRLFPDFQGSRFSRDTPEEFRARVRARGWGVGEIV